MRSPARYLNALLVLTALSFAGPAFSADPPGILSGAVRDALGHGIEGAEILVFPAGALPQARFASVTDESGRFVIGGLPRGAYRVAALKPGYLAAVGRVDTALRATFDIVLRPSPRPGEPGYERVRESLSWVLRAPARSVLRDLGPDDSLAEARGDDPGAGSAHGEAIGPAVEGRVRHLVAVGGLNRGRAGGSSLQGGETSMELAGTLGGHASLSVLGQRRRIESISDELGETPAGKRDAASLSVGFSYDTGPDTVIDIKAYYARDGAELVSSNAPTTSPGREEHRSWGYDATWTRQLDRVSRLAVQIGFVDASLELPPGRFAGAPAFEMNPAFLANLNNRAAEAEGRYESVLGDGHTVSVSMRAQLLDLALPLVRGGTETTFLGLPGAAGLAVRLDAEDAWMPLTPWTFSYGLGIHQALDGRDSTLLSPRVGVEWGGPRWHTRGVLAYHDVASSGSMPSGLDEVGVFRPEKPWGYEGEVEAGITDSIRVRATAVYNPVQGADRQSDELTWADGRPLFLRGGNASDRFVGVTVEHQTPRAATFARWREGRSSGLLADSLAYDSPLQVFSEREVRYVAGGIGARFPTTGTDLSLDYRRLETYAVSGEASGAAGPVAEYVEMSFGQRLVRLPRYGASCQLLVAARASTHSGQQGAGSSVDVERARGLAALNDRISAGLVVAF